MTPDPSLGTRHRLVLTPLLLFLTLAGTASAAAAQCKYYVRAGFEPPNGTVADGLSPERAFSTIRAAAQRLQNPGEVVCVGPGEYVEGNITPSRSGIPNNPVMFLADRTGALTGDPPGSVRVVPPENLPIEQTPTAGFRILGQRDIVIEGFELEGYFDAAIQVRSRVDAPGNASNVAIRNNTIRFTSKTGIDVSAEGDVIVEGNVVVGNGVGAEGGSGISIQSCADGGLGEDAPRRCRGGPSGPVRPIVINNRVGVNADHGLYCAAAENGIVQNNVIYSNDATGITLRNAPDFLVVNNLVYRNAEQGLAVGSADLPAPRAKIVNNTFYDNGLWGIEIGGNTTASPGAMVANNVLHLNGQGQQGIGVRNESGLSVRSTCGYVAGFNVVFDTYGVRTPRNVYDVVSDPLFSGPISGPDGIIGGHWVGTRLVDASADDDFRLLQESSRRVSPAIDAGYATVEEVGLHGSTSPDGSPDTGILDAGYHYGAAPEVVSTLPTPFMPLFVRLGGNASNTGKARDEAFNTITAAALRARAGVTVIVGPGVYRECQLRPPPDQGRATFLADSVGEHTGDLPGPVLIDVRCCLVDSESGACVPGFDAFNVPNSCFVIVDGFHVTGAADDGIAIQAGSHGAEVRNNVVFTNQGRGISVINSHDVRVINNLAYDNLAAGITIGGSCPSGVCEDAGSRRAVIESNTCYGNGVNGILIGSGPGHSTEATVRYNILHVGGAEKGWFGENGIQLGSSTMWENHLEGYHADYNVVFGGFYGSGTPIPLSDRTDDPLLLDPAGPDGILGGSNFRDDSFHLRQTAAGQQEHSPAVDFSDVAAEVAGLDMRTTRSDLSPDLGFLDLGFHYPIYSASLVGDCNGDGRVTVDEILAGLNIALAMSPIYVCPNADADGDGIVGITELLSAVRRAIAGF